ncbi:glycosyltransferase [Chlamydiales bacterium]|nr:glycosyltransferase [Chlamydiales bacterium]
MDRRKKVGVAVITYQSKHHLKRCLTPLLNSTLNPYVLVVDASSTDGTVEEAKRLGADVLSVPYNSYNHGTTRELARKALGSEIVIMMTPDAYLKDERTLSHLIAPIEDRRAVLSYGRQLPHKGANYFESFARYFNYPHQSSIRSLEDQDKYGSFLYFFSDSFGAYLNCALDEIGGFSPVLLGEDTIACAKLLKKGYSVAYVSESEVYHSHSYSLKQEFQRHFDTGMMRSDFKELLNQKRDQNRGILYAKKLFQEVKRGLILYAFFHIIAKWLGYKLGGLAKNWPLFIKRRFSSQKFYWKNSH